MRKLAGLVLVGILALPSPLAGAQVVTGNDRDLAAVGVDKQQPISLTVRKIAPNPNDDVPDGHRPPGPVSGAKFQLAKVTAIDVTTPAGRQQAKNMDVDSARALGLGEVATAITNDLGYAYFANLGPGLYLLEEQRRSDGVHEFEVSAPKLVLLPLGSVDGSRFTYDNVVVTKKGSDSTPPTTTPPITSTPQTLMPSLTSTPNSPPTSVSNPPSASTTEPEGGNRGGLAETGANVLWTAGSGALLIFVGIFMARRRNRNDA